MVLGDATNRRPHPAGLAPPAPKAGHAESLDTGAAVDLSRLCLQGGHSGWKPRGGGGGMQPAGAGAAAPGRPALVAMPTPAAAAVTHLPPARAPAAATTDSTPPAEAAPPSSSVALAKAGSAGSAGATTGSTGSRSRRTRTAAVVLEETFRVSVCVGVTGGVKRAGVVERGETARAAH